jgi:succinate dehydrogenase/fumarate reductase cytochrome b subunit
MAENTSRSVFSLHGVTGMLIATVLLLSILVFLTYGAIKVQSANATNAYDPTPITGSLDNVKMKSKDNADFAFKDAK